MSPPTASSSSTSLVVQLCEVTGCSHTLAVKLMDKVGQDLAAAVDMFYDKQDGVRVKDNTGRVVNDVEVDEIFGDVTNTVVQKSANVIIIDDTIEAGYVIEDKMLVKKADDANANIKTDVEIVSEYTEEEMMQQALEASAAEHQRSEPTPEANFQILSQNYPHLDHTALNTLCKDYSGRSAELEKFVQFHIHDLPTKLDVVEKTKLKSQIEEIIVAGVEGAEKMIVEDCPKCKSPKIVEDPSVKVFTCLNLECKGEFCRKCKMEQHIPYKCEGQLFDDNAEYQVVNILPKRMFDETDPLDREFRIAEGQFLRMNAKAKQNYEITSIDVVFNRSLDQKFAEKKEELSIQGFGDWLLLFHGTHQKNIEPILQNNFDLSIRTNGRAFGDGVYFSECPEVSLGYSLDQKSLILCKVLLGNNCKEVKKGDTRCWAIVVPDVNQIRHQLHTSREERVPRTRTQVASFEEF